MIASVRPSRFTPWNQPHPLPSRARFIRRLVAVALAIVLSFAAIEGAWLDRSRTLYRERAAIATLNLATTLEQDIAASLGLISLTLLSLKDTFEQRAAAGPIDFAALEDHIARQKSRVPAADTLRIADVGGTIMYGRPDITATRINVADRDYFQLCRDGPSGRLVFSRPTLSRTTGRWVIILARRLDNSDGGFAGIVYAAIPLAYFSAMFSGVNVGDHGAIALRDANMALVARYPELSGPGGSVGAPVISPELRRVFGAGNRTATYTAFAPIDGVFRTYSYHQVADYPLYVNVGVAVDDYLGDWRKEVYRSLALLALLATVTCVSSRVIYRSWRRQADAVTSLAAQELRFRTIADYTYDWENWIDAEGRVQWISPAVARLTGHAVERCMAMPAFPAPLVHPDDRERMATLFEGAVAGTSGNDVEFRLNRVDGTERWGAISWQPVFHPDGQPNGHRSCIRDVTERKQRELELREAKVAAELAAQTKSRFLATMSHELRTPLNAILGFTNLIKEPSFCPISNPLCLEYLGYIHQSGAHLLEILTDVIDLTRIADGKLNLAPDLVPVPTLFNAVAGVMAASAVEGGAPIRLKVQPGIPEVWADWRSAKQILLNLLSNAVKFTPGGGEITLAAVATAAGIEISVADTGIGISAADLTRILSPFEQVDSGYARRHGGLGIGLALVKGLVDLHGGRLDIVSEPGVGTTVTVLFPPRPAQT